VPAMVERVKGWIAEGLDVRIFTARVAPYVFEDGGDDAARSVGEQVQLIEAWCLEHLGRVLPITCSKDYAMARCYDDRAVQVEKNTGRLIEEPEEPEEPASPQAAEPTARAARCTTSGKPIDEHTREIDPVTGMQKDYIVLCADERAKGFVRPYRNAYTHLTCGTVTTMGRALSETYARDPAFYSGTFCATCRTHFPLTEFVWTADGTPVGS
jgi:hypothetical protein